MMTVILMKVMHLKKKKNKKKKKWFVVFVAYSEDSSTTNEVPATIVKKILITDVQANILMSQTLHSLEAGFTGA